MVQADQRGAIPLWRTGGSHGFFSQLATLAPLSPADSAPLYVEMMGGADAILGRAQALYDEGQYRLAMEILNKLVYAEPNNSAGQDLLAAVFEQLGYQYESASMRNVFLSSAQELRNGVPVIGAPRGTSPSLARAMTTAQWWDAVAIRVDSSKADAFNFTINFITPDTRHRAAIRDRNEWRHINKYRRLYCRKCRCNNHHESIRSGGSHHGPGHVG